MGAEIAVDPLDREDVKPPLAHVQDVTGLAIGLGVEAEHIAVRGTRPLLPQAFVAVDVLVNNAGVIGPIGMLEGCDPNSWAHNLLVNLVGVFNCCRAALPYFQRAGEGVIVNLSSGAAHRPLEGWSVYCASKAGVAMLTRSIALEAGGAGVRAYGLQPGVVDTDMQGEIRASGTNEVSRIARERLANPSEPARVVAWLCTEGAADLAGNELSINDPELRRRVGLDG